MARHNMTNTEDHDLLITIDGKMDTVISRLDKMNGRIEKTETSFGKCQKEKADKIARIEENINTLKRKPSAVKAVIWVGLIITMIISLWGIFALYAKGETIILDNVVIDKPDSVSDSLLEAFGFEITDNIAIGRFQNMSEYSTYFPEDSGWIYIELPEYRFDVRRDGLINLRDLTCLVFELYRGGCR